MTTWNATGTADVTNGSTTVSTTSDFRSDKIEIGRGFQLPTDTRVYQVTALNEAAGEFTIEPAYEGTTATLQPFWVLPMLGVALDAERALREAAEAFEAAVSEDPLDTTPGRLKRVGDFGEDGQTTILAAENDLDNITTPGIYGWSGSDVPLNAPATSGSHAMQVYAGSGSVVIQVVIRQTASHASARGYWRMVSLTGSNTDWATNWGTGNTFGTVAMTNGFPSGSLYEEDSGTLGTIDTPGYTTYRWTKEASGVMTMELEITLDASSTLSQTFSYPTTFVGGGWTSVSGFGHTVSQSSGPNPALQFDNIEGITSFNSTVQVKLATAGTQPSPATDNEKLRITIRGRWVA